MEEHWKLKAIMVDGELSEDFTTDEKLQSHGFKNILETPEIVLYADPYNEGGTQTFYIDKTDKTEDPDASMD